MAAAAGQPECDVTSQVTEAVQCEDWTELSRLIEQGHLSELSQEQRNRVVNETCTPVSYTHLTLPTTILV